VRISKKGDMPRICSRCGHSVTWSSVSKKERKERRETGTIICGMCAREDREAGLRPTTRRLP
jgi:transcription elongation factor Elf1